MTVVAPAATPARSLPTRASRPAIVLLALVGLVAAYGLLSLLNDPRGTLGTDTGGKLATLVAMDRNGTVDPDVGYWAEDLDPRGDLHPLYYTDHVGDRWVNLTTLPMVVAAKPLYALGGPRAVLLLPMLGAAFAALAARALARRVGGGDGWWAFWTVGLASPLAIYALDFWEHAPGVALVLWGGVFLYDVVDRRAGWRGALVSGACFGAAATMRTEALVFAAVAAAVAGVLLLRRAWRDRSPAPGVLVALGAAWSAGVVALVVSNQVLERALVGGGIRASRAAGTASAAGAGADLRAKEALTTAVGLNQFVPSIDWVVGGAMVALVMYASWRLTASDRSGRLLGGAAFVAAALLYWLKLSDGLGFVPGVLSASPLAAAGLALGWSARRWRPVGVAAGAAVPIVWYFQYSGGANPQWGARYLLVTGTLLVVGAAVVLAATPGWARWAIVGLAAVVTLSGVAWLSQRSNAVADAMETLRVGPDTVLVSREAHLLREGGAFLTPDQRWLTAEDDRELDRAVAIASAVDARHLEVISVVGRPAPRRLGGFTRVSRRTMQFLPGLDVTVARYDPSEPG